MKKATIPGIPRIFFVSLTKTSLQMSGVRLRGGARPDSGQSGMAKEDL